MSDPYAVYQHPYDPYMRIVPRPKEVTMYPGTLAQLDKPKPPPKPTYPVGDLGKQKRPRR